MVTPNPRGRDATGIAEILGNGNFVFHSEMLSVPRGSVFDFVIIP
jgi:hypothetical protein